MINNRQAGRRRGRGGQRPSNNQGRPDQGNRIDNRARGNANQLHEKYKSLARDAQMAGDRVNTEYYLQFADHYFRVLSESRSRHEDSQQQRRQHGAANDFDDDDDNRDDEQREERGRRQHGGEQQSDENRAAPNGRDEGDGEERQPRRARPRRQRAEESEEGERSIEADRLPPSLSDEGARLNGADEEPAPRRRARKPRAAEGEGAVQG